MTVKRKTGGAIETARDAHRRKTLPGCKNDFPSCKRGTMERIGETLMKHPFLRHVLTLAVCACLAVTLVTAFFPARSAHAATTSAASCQNYNYSPGQFFENR